ncbi:MAG: type II secretion system major pseudopilin GspG [Nitrospirae bacterium]|nr:type II secretion system major pseudopilin GspG [Nitrospirota bacterium]
MIMRILNDEKGLTLIELMVVIVILGLLAALVAPKMFGRLGESKQKAAKAQIELFGTALDSFRLDAGKYPATSEGLQALRVKPSGVENWKGPYLPKEVPNDPWGHPYHYSSPGEHGDYDLYSFGADNTAGGDGENQDVVSWK